MNKSGKPRPTIIKLKDLWRYYYQLDFLTDPTRQDIKRKEKVSVKAYSIITKIYHELLDQYDKKAPNVYQSINKVCVRLVFASMLITVVFLVIRNMFHDYMNMFLMIYGEWHSSNYLLY